MAERARMSGLSIFLLTAASFVVVVAGMKSASPLIVPFLLAIFISIICMPPVVWLRRHRVPNFLSVLIVLVCILIVGSILVTLMGTSLGDFSNNLPSYQARLAEKSAALIAWLNSHGVDISGEFLKEYFNPGSIMKLAANTFTELSGVLTNAFMIFFIVIFILLEVTEFPAKLRAALAHPGKSIEGFDKIGKSVDRYLAIKTIFSLATGVSVGIWLWIIGVDYALLWGVLAFILNYVPNIGSIIAAVPAVLLAIIQFGLGHALLAAIGYAVVNTVFGSILEPKFMGRGLGLSTLVVILSLIFWGWVLGPVGMFLSVPLTMIFKIVMEGSEETRWISVLIGPSPGEQKGATEAE
jgi:AI-2 transport protein TqsA